MEKWLTKCALYIMLGTKKEPVPQIRLCRLHRNRRGVFCVKYTKKCPKCGGEKIMQVWLPSWASSRQAFPLSWWRDGVLGIQLARYVCEACGYMEEWVDKQDIPRLNQKYPTMYK